LDNLDTNLFYTESNLPSQPPRNLMNLNSDNFLGSQIPSNFNFQGSNVDGSLLRTQNFPSANSETGNTSRKRILDQISNYEDLE